MMIEFSDHALRKMEQRHLKKEWVLQALDTPNHEAPSYENRMVVYKQIEKLYLAVIYIKDKEKIVVITAHWEKGFKLKKEA